VRIDSEGSAFILTVLNDPRFDERFDAKLAKHANHANHARQPWWEDDDDAGSAASGIAAQSRE